MFVVRVQTLLSSNDDDVELSAPVAATHATHSHCSDMLGVSFLASKINVIRPDIFFLTKICRTKMEKSVSQ